MLTTLKNPKVIISIAIVIGLIAVGTVLITSSRKPTQNYYTVKAADITESVNVSGTIKGAEDVNLAFTGGGKITSVKGNVGDSVTAGEALVYLDTATLSASLEGAEANVDAQEAKLNQLQNGARPEESAVAASGVLSASSSLLNAKQALADQIKSSYATADDALRTKIDELYTYPRSVDPQIIQFGDYNLTQSLNNQRVSVGELLVTWQSSIANLDASNVTDADANTARANLATFQSFIADLTVAVSSLSPNQTMTQTIINGYIADISLARTNINNSVAALNAAQDALDASEAQVSLSQNQYALTTAPGTADDITAQEAQVEAAHAAVDSINAEISENILRSPIDGTITVQNAHVGEIAAPGTPIVSVISNQKYQVETYVSEADIAKVKIGDIANVTLDAYKGQAPLEATVISVDPATTMVNGTESYKVDLEFNQDNPEISQGMTANVSIVAAEKQNVLSVPSQSIIVKDNNSYVLLDNGKGGTTLEQVNVGLQDDNQGMTEIVSGLSAGQRILTY